jgi:hypothetical protein
VWFLLGQNLEDFRTFASMVLGPHANGPRFTVHQVEIASDPDTVMHVLDRLGTEVQAGLADIMNDVMEATGGMADRSINVRMGRADKFLEKVRLYEQVLGRQLEATRDRFRVGEVTRTDVSQAEARLARNRLAGLRARVLRDVALGAGGGVAVHDAGLGGLVHRGGVGTARHLDRSAVAGGHRLLKFLVQGLQARLRGPVAGGKAGGFAGGLDGGFGVGHGVR